MIFDLYNTIIDIRTDEKDLATYNAVSKWLMYQGVMIAADRLKVEYATLIEEKMNSSKEDYPEIRVEEIFSRICKDNSIWDIDHHELGIETARVFRSASLRRLEVFPQSHQLIKDNPHLKKCVLSNGQRVFSELEMRFLGIYELFDLVIFSSDVRYKKPNPKLYQLAMHKMKLKPDEILFIGDTPENDIIAPKKMGMKAIHINEAWEHMNDFL